ncbi:ABC transporter ATP-binding protein [Devosia sp. WQ 349]|uniref:ABC transporter ATP-binding protein n=1 Tax=Devosia sp. WQ 349K1 TaxID=2800329 RepID=UPI00190506AD|nr:ABC transporter ATP-binding protein [Devosia sp. WQ 349K1]MBK1796191.1 ABC transporter ATP-binding protein [Devosia sp. WQ 349K1]
MILRLAGVTKRFGAVVVADNIDLNVARGEALGIIGANGAGKSSLFNLITGVVTADAGTITIGDKDVTKVSVPDRCVAGVGRSFQIPRPFETLTVFENLLVAAEYGRASRALSSEALCASILEQTGLAAHANTLAGKLTLLNRKRLELARALATQPDLILLDEIAGGLTEAECHELVAFIQQLHQTGVTIIWIEHVVHALLSVVDRLIVLEFGRKIADGKPDAVMSDPVVRRSYLGIDDEAAA